MNWSIKRKKGPPWPNNEDGNPIPPVFLTHLHGVGIDMELTINLLEAYGIPHVPEYPLNGQFGKMIMGFPPGGVKIYVPETMLEDAQNILSADFSEEELEAEIDNES